MTNTEREFKTLSFSNEGLDRGAVEETFEPWDLTIDNWSKEGLQTNFNNVLTAAEIPTEIGYIWKNKEIPPEHHYYMDMLYEPIFNLESQLGYDPVIRCAFRIPFLSYKSKVLEDTDNYFIRFDRDGWTRKYEKHRDLVTTIKPVVENEEDWEKHKAHTLEAYNKYCTDENLERIYGPIRELSKNGDMPIRFRLQGFFWCPRDLMDVEEHLIGYYDYPEMMHDFVDFQVKLYKEQMEKILKIITPSVVFFEEDLSGKTGPMISPDDFDEFVLPGYLEMVPFLKERGVKNVFVDTDGDFTLLIPNFRKGGVDGFLPVDVNAGVDIVEVRKKHPDVKFIGGFNKLNIVDGPEAIDAEFERLMPVIRQGGYMPGIDHQAAPATTYENYLYYIKRLKEVMAENRNENCA